MTLPVPASTTSVRRVGVLVACVVALGLALTWAFFSMRAVMGVGGACADGGPYVSAQPCPGGAALIAVAVPLMLVAAMVGTAVALSVNAPNLLIPMWGFLFGSLGWNFLEYGFTSPDGLVWGWIICGVVFEAMALPALYAIVVGLRLVVAPAAPGPTGSTAREDRSWWLWYSALGAAGATLGVLSFNALS